MSTTDHGDEHELQLEVEVEVDQDTASVPVSAPLSEAPHEYEPEQEQDEPAGTESIVEQEPEPEMDLDDGDLPPSPSRSEPLSPSTQPSSARGPCEFHASSPIPFYSALRFPSSLSNQNKLTVYPDIDSGNNSTQELGGEEEEGKEGSDAEAPISEPDVSDGSDQEPEGDGNGNEHVLNDEQAP